MEALYTKGLNLVSVKFIEVGKRDQSVISTGRLLKSKVNFKNNHAEVEILEKETGISPGQACVFYLKDDVGDKVLGGGWIDKTFNNYLSTKLTIKN